MNLFFSWLLLTPYSTANPSPQAEILATHESGDVWSQSSESCLPLRLPPPYFLPPHDDRLPRKDEP